MELGTAIFRALRSLAAPGIFIVIIETVIVTFMALCLFVVGMSWLAFYTAAHMHNAWSGALAWGGSAGAALLAWMLFPGIMPVIVSFFDDKIANLIEARDYPTPHREPPHASDFLHDLMFGLKALFWNVLCLPLYLVPGLNLCVFYLLNGYLLGKEFFLMAARRHMPYAQAEQLRVQHGFTLFVGGVLFTLLATVPLLNLVAPFCGVALAVHLFHQVYRQGTQLPASDQSVYLGKQ